MTPLKAIMNSSKIASTITNATGCTDGPYCKLAWHSTETRMDLCCLHTHAILFVVRKYNSSDVKEACDGADVAIVCLGTGNQIEVSIKENEKIT